MDVLQLRKLWYKVLRFVELMIRLFISTLSHFNRLFTVYTAIALFNPIPVNPSWINNALAIITLPLSNFHSEKAAPKMTAKSFVQIKTFNSITDCI